MKISAFFFKPNLHICSRIPLPLIAFVHFSMTPKPPASLPQRTCFLNDPFLSLTKLQKWIIWACMEFVHKSHSYVTTRYSYLKIIGFGVCSVEERRLTRYIAWHTHLKGLRFKGVTLIFKVVKLLNFTVGLKPQIYEFFFDSANKLRFPEILPKLQPHKYVYWKCNKISTPKVK